MAEDHRTWRVLPAALLVAILDQAGRPFPALWPRRDLDASWMTGLALAGQRGLQFGEDIVFPYGPWGGLDAPMGIDHGTVWIAGGFRALAIVALFAALTWCLPPGKWRGVTAGAVALLVGNCSTGGWMLMLAVSLVGLACLGRTRTPSLTLLVMGSVCSALLLQVKFSEGTLALAVVGWVALCTPRPVTWLCTATTFGVAFAAFWLAAEQSLVNVVPWLSLSVELVRGYPEAMALFEPDGLTVVMIVGLAVTSLAVLLGRGLTLQAKLCALGITLFMSKVALGLSDPGHLRLGYTGLLVVLVAVAGAAPWRAQRFATVAMATVLASSMLVPQTALARDFSSPILSTPNWPGRDASREAQVRRQIVEDLAIEPELLSLLDGHPVTVDPWEVSAAWAHEFDWQPTPLIQRYAAFTPRLDRLNAEVLMEIQSLRVLHESGLEVLGYEDWETPAFKFALVCNFEEIGAGVEWSVFARGASRCGPERPVSTQRIESGEVIPLPAADDSLIALRFMPDQRSVVDRLLAFVGPQRNLLNATVGDQIARVPEALAGGPLIVGAPPGEPALNGEPAPASISFDRAGELEIVEIPLSEAAEG